MATVRIKKGDILEVVWCYSKQTPLGICDVESNIQLTYGELFTKLQLSGNGRGKTKRSSTLGRKFSRFVSLACSAIEKGKWATGAHIDANKVFNSLVCQLHELDNLEYDNITTKAKAKLFKLCTSNKLTGQQKKSLKDFLVTAEI